VKELSMTTTVVTKATGGRASPLPAVYVPTEQQPTTVDTEALPGAAFDIAALLDLLSACVAHERCGVHLYRSVAGRTADRELRTQYEEFGAETLEHVAKLEELISAAGGDPQYVSFSARATEKAGAGLLETTFMLDGSVDALASEVAMLEAVMLAEAKDRANWMLLADLAPGVGDSDLGAKFAAVTDEVLLQEEEHYAWATETRAALLQSAVTGAAAPARRPASSGDGMTRDELYREAQELDIPGRSAMSKEELVVAVEAVKDGAS
jgi:rubrerythrin